MSGVSQRLAWVDHLRAATIALVVNMHACVTYSHIGDWYFESPSEPGPLEKGVFLIWQAHLQAFFMGLLFLLAGVFARGSMERRGPGPFMVERLRRLGLPTLFYSLVLNPFILLGLNPWHAKFPPLPAFYAHYLASGRFLSSTGPLWFAFALLIFCAIYAGAAWAGLSVPGSRKRVAGQPARTSDASARDPEAPAQGGDASAPDRDASAHDADAPAQEANALSRDADAPAQDASRSARDASASSHGANAIATQTRARKRLLQIGVGMGLATFAMRLVQPLGTNVLNFQLGYFPQYVIAFASGVMLGGPGLRELAASPEARRAGWVALVNGPWVLVAILVEAHLGGRDLSDFVGGWRWPAAELAVWEQLTGLGLALGALSLFHRHFAGDGRIGRWISDHAFAVYVFHAPVLIALTMIFLRIHGDALALCALLTAAALVATFAVAAVARRTPFLRAIL